MPQSGSGPPARATAWISRSIDVHRFPDVRPGWGQFSRSVLDHHERPRRSRPTEDGPVDQADVAGPEEGGGHRLAARPHKGSAEDLEDGVGHVRIAEVRI